jgi:dTDP-4-dehydrorhamnose 3,5-epimerase
MQIQIKRTNLPGAFIVVPELFKDDRGFFSEIYRKDQCEELGAEEFVQLNHSGSVKNVLRGLHFQWEPPMGKLMRVTRGTAYLVAVDIRKNSPTLGKWFGTEVSAENHIQVWAPAGFARGFCVLSDYAELQYLCSGVYNSKAESGILWNDPEVGIEWPVKEPILSGKDVKAQTLDEWLRKPESNNFTYQERNA